MNDQVLVFDCTVTKVEPDDERFPGWDAIKRPNGSILGFTDLYVCDMKTSDGPMQIPFFVTEALRAQHTSSECLALMLELFAKTIREGKRETAEAA